MKKIIFIIALISLSSISVFSQVKEGKNFEFGAGYNFLHVNNTSGPNKGSGPDAYFEFREMIDGFDFGGQLNYRYSRGEMNLYGDETLWFVSKAHQIGLKAVGDYIFCEGQMVNPYVGLSLGGGLMLTDRTDNYNKAHFYLTLGLRAGVQIKFIRIAIEGDLYGNNSWRVTTFGRGTSTYIFGSSLALNLGFAF